MAVHQPGFPAVCVEGAPYRADFQYRVMHNESRKSETKNDKRKWNPFGLAWPSSLLFFVPFSKVIFSQYRQQSDAIEVFSLSYWFYPISVKLCCVFCPLSVCTQGSAFVGPMSVLASVCPCNCSSQRTMFATAKLIIEPTTRMSIICTCWQF